MNYCRSHVVITATEVDHLTLLAIGAEVLYPPAAKVAITNTDSRIPGDSIRASMSKSWVVIIVFSGEGAIVKAEPDNCVDQHSPF